MGRHPTFEPSPYSFQVVPIIMEAVGSDNDICWADIEVLEKPLKVKTHPRVAKRTVSGPEQLAGTRSKRLKTEGKTTNSEEEGEMRRMGGQVRGRGMMKDPVTKNAGKRSGNGRGTPKVEGKGKGKAKAAEVVEQDATDSEVEVGIGNDEVCVPAYNPQRDIEEWLFDSHS